MVSKGTHLRQSISCSNGAYTHNIMPSCSGYSAGSIKKCVSSVLTVEKTQSKPERIESELLEALHAHTTEQSQLNARYVNFSHQSHCPQVKTKDADKKPAKKKK